MFRLRRWLPPRLSRRSQAGLNDRELLVAESFFSGTATASHQSFFVPLLVHLGVSSGALGLYSAFNGLLMNVSGLAGGRAVGRVSHRRVLAALASGVGRGLFLIVPVVLVLRGNDTSIALLIAVALASATLIGLGLPAVTSMVADAVEARQRGTFFANRALAGGAGATIVAFGVAALLGLLAFPNGFTAAYLLAGLAGIGSASCLFRLREVHDLDGGAGATDAPAVHAPLSPLMWRYAGATFILWFGASMVAPVLTPYILNDLGASPSFIGLQSGLSAIVAMSCQRLWGKRIDRLGSFGVLSGCTVAVSTLPALYAVAPTYWFGLGYEVIAAIGWSGYMLSSVNFAFDLAPERERARYTAVSNAAAGVGSFAGPLIGAALAGVLPVRSVLFIAAGFRLLSFFALRFARPAGHTSPMPRLPVARRRLRIPSLRRGGAVGPGAEGRAGEE